MDKPISIGDLVQVIRPSVCQVGAEKALGLIFIVRSIIHEDSAPRPWCAYCGAKHEHPGTMIAEVHHHKWIHIYRLKRIPPLEELEGEKREETVNA